MCDLNLERCSVFHERRRRARKSHYCDACGGGIAAGSLYTVHFSVLDDVASEKMCTPCEYTMRSLAKGHGQRCPPSSLAPVLEECIDVDGLWWMRRALSAMGKRGAEKSPD